MLRVGLTGNAGSGKSTVAQLWREHGVHVIDADELGREVVDRNPELRQALAIEFGEEVMEGSAGAEVGAIKRAELARRAFVTPDRTRALNALVHPPLLELLRERLDEAERLGRAIAVVDAALIFEFGNPEEYDRIVLVSAPEAVRLERLRVRGLDEATLRGLLASQMPDEAKAARADHVLVNDGSREELRARALEVLEELRAAAGDADTAAEGGGRTRSTAAHARGG